MNPSLQTRDNLKNCGFTLIELLVVMGIVAVLVTGLVIAVNPAEHLFKARDTVKKDVARVLVSSINSYSASKGYFPWDAAGGCADPNNGDNITGYTMASGWSSCITVLENSSELKSNVANSSALSSLYVSYDVAKKEPVVCFVPQSKSVKENKSETKYWFTGVDAWCDENNPAANCAWCMR